jgi:hypothetical protein
MYLTIILALCHFLLFFFWRADNIVSPPNILTNVFGPFWPFAYVINQDVPCVMFFTHLAVIPITTMPIA